METTRFRAFQILSASLVLTAILYFPGLFGGFVLDDVANLRGLANLLSNTEEFWLYVFSGYAGPVGRPVSLLTFAIQATSWPDHPLHFKVVNIALHLVNGVLVFAVLHRVIAAVTTIDKTRAIQLATFATVLWLVHPVHVSGVSYVVQRMNLLSSLFMLLGLIAYLNGRRAAIEGRRAGIIMHAFIALPIAALFALGSKENAVSLLFIVATIEFGFMPAMHDTLWRWWRRLYVVVPLVVAVAVIALFWNSLTSGYELKPFTLTERLLTQPRVLFSYLKVLLFPAGPDIGLLHDDFVISTGITSPLTTLLSLSGLALLIAAIIRYRRRFVLITLGLAWFLTAHLLEGSVFPLEMYFEHRNYLPSVGFALAFVVVTAKLLAHVRDPRLKKLAWLAAAIYGLSLAWLNFAENLLWGDTIRQAFVWYDENPQSRRAQVLKGSMLRVLGREEEMIRHFQDIAEQSKAPAAIYFTWLEEVCLDPSVRLPPRGKLIASLDKETSSIGPTNVVELILGMKERGECEGVPLEVLRDILFHLSQTPTYQNQLELIRAQQGRLAYLYGDAATAIGLLQESDRLKPDVWKSLQISLWAVYSANCKVADEYLQISRRRVDSIPAGNLMYDDRLELVNSLRQRLEENDSCQQKSTD